MDLSFSQKIRFSIIVAGLLPWLLFSALMLHYRNGPAERLETQLTLIWQQLNQQLDYMLNSSMAAAHLDTPLPPMISGYWETRQGHWQGSGIAPPIQEYQCDDPPCLPPCRRNQNNSSYLPVNGKATHCGYSSSICQPCSASSQAKRIRSGYSSLLRSASSPSTASTVG